MLISMVAMVQALSSAATLNVLAVAVFGVALSGAAILADRLSESVEELLCPSYDACSSTISWTSFGVSVVGLGTVVHKGAGNGRRKRVVDRKRVEFIDL